METFPFIQIIFVEKANLYIIWWRREKKPPKRKSNHPDHRGRNKKKVLRSANNTSLLKFQAKAGFVLNILGVLTITLAINTWASSLFQLQTFPSWANKTGTCPWGREEKNLECSWQSCRESTTITHRAVLHSVQKDKQTPPADSSWKNCPVQFCHPSRRTKWLLAF